MQKRLITVVAAIVLALGLVPGTAGGQANPLEQVFASDNVKVVNRLAEGAGAISLQFDSDKPFMYLSTLKGSKSTTSRIPETPSS